MTSGPREVAPPRNLGVDTSLSEGSQADSAELTPEGVSPVTPADLRPGDTGRRAPHRGPQAAGGPVWQGDDVRLINPLWYLAALTIALGGQVVGTAIAASSWDAVRDAPLVNVSEPVDATGASVAVFTDVPQPDRDIRCVATETAADADDAEPVDVPEAPLDLTAVADGTTWHLVGFLLDPPDAEVRVACAAQDGAGDSASYTASTPEGVGDRANLGNGIAWLFTLAGIVLAIYVFTSRRRHRKETRP